MIKNAILFTEKQETRGKRALVTADIVRQVKRYSCESPLAAVRQIRDNICPVLWLETVSQILRDQDLFARSTRAVPLLKQTHIMK